MKEKFSSVVKIQISDKDGFVHVYNEDKTIFIEMSLDENIKEFLNGSQYKYMDSIIVLDEKCENIETINLINQVTDKGW